MVSRDLLDLKIFDLLTLASWLYNSFVSSNFHTSTPLHFTAICCALFRQQAVHSIFTVICCLGFNCFGKTYCRPTIKNRYGFAEQLVVG